MLRAVISKGLELKRKLISKEPFLPTDASSVLDNRSAASPWEPSCLSGQRMVAFFSWHISRSIARSNFACSIGERPMTSMHLTLSVQRFFLAISLMSEPASSSSLFAINRTTSIATLPLPITAIRSPRACDRCPILLLSDCGYPFSDRRISPAPQT